jgi:hypothetical protein
MPKRITIQLVGSLSDKEDVRLSDLIEQLRVVKKALLENERVLTEHPILDYKVVDLRHNSPATIVLEPVGSDGIQPANTYISQVLTDFSNELRAIKRDGKLLREPEINRLEAYQQLGHQKDSLITKLRIVIDRKAVTIDENFNGKIEDILGPDELIEGSISGMLEAVNFHRTNKFTLWPMLGPRKIAGTFAPDLRPKVKDAIGRFVTVPGQLRYKAWSPFPHGVVAEDIDPHLLDSELPTLSELKGAFPELTGGLTSVEFVERIRNEGW